MGTTKVMRRIHQSLQAAELYVKTNQISNAFNEYENCLKEIKDQGVDLKEECEWAFMKAVVVNSNGVAHLKANELKNALKCFRESYELKSSVLEKQASVDKAGNGNKGRSEDGNSYEDSCDLVAPLYNMGRVYHYNKQYDEAKHFYETGRVRTNTQNIL